MDNLIIKVHGSIITVEGSLVKFHEGNNLCSLNRETTKQAIDLLGDRLHLDIKSAHVTRIDIAENFEMSHNVREYLPFLGYYPRHKRDSKYRTSLYLWNQTAILVSSTTKEKNCRVKKEWRAVY